MLTAKLCNLAQCNNGGYISPYDVHIAVIQVFDLQMFNYQYSLEVTVIHSVCLHNFVLDMSASCFDAYLCRHRHGLMVESMTDWFSHFHSSAMHSRLS